MNSIKSQNRIGTIFRNFENSKTFDPLINMFYYQILAINTNRKM